MPQVYELTFNPAGNIPSGTNKYGWLWLPERGDDPTAARFLQWSNASAATSNTPATADRIAALANAAGTTLTVDDGGTAPGGGFTAFQIFQTINALNALAAGGDDSPWDATAKDFSDLLAYATPGQYLLNIVDDTGGDAHGKVVNLFYAGRKATFSLWNTTINGSAPADSFGDEFGDDLLYVEYTTGANAAALVVLFGAKITAFDANLLDAAVGPYLSVGLPSDFSGASDPSDSRFAEKGRFFHSASGDAIANIDSQIDPGWLFGPVGDSNIIVLTADDGTAYTDVPTVEAVDSGISFPPPPVPVLVSFEPPDPQVYEFTFFANQKVMDQTYFQYAWIWLPSRDQNPAHARYVQFYDSLGPTTTPATAAHQSSLTFGQGQQIEVWQGNSVAGEYTPYFMAQLWAVLDDMHSGSEDSPWIPSFKDFADFLAYATPAQVRVTFTDDVSSSSHDSYFYITASGRQATIYLWDALANGSNPGDISESPSSQGTYYVDYSTDDGKGTIAGNVVTKLLGIGFEASADFTGGYVVVGEPSTVSGAADPAAVAALDYHVFVDSVAGGGAGVASITTLASPGWASGAVGDSNKLLLTADSNKNYVDTARPENFNALSAFTFTSGGTSHGLSSPASFGTPRVRVGQTVTLSQVPQRYTIQLNGASAAATIIPTPGTRYGWIFVPSRTDDPTDAYAYPFEDPYHFLSDNVPTTADRQAAFTNSHTYGTANPIAANATQSVKPSWWPHAVWALWSNMASANLLDDNPFVPTFRSWKLFKQWAAGGEYQITCVADSGGTLHNTLLEFYAGGQRVQFYLWDSDFGTFPGPNGLDADTNYQYWVEYTSNASAETLRDALYTAVNAAGYPCTTVGSTRLRIGDHLAFAAYTSPPTYDPAAHRACMIEGLTFTGGGSDTLSLPSLYGDYTSVPTDADVIDLAADDFTVYTDVVEADGLSGNAVITAFPAETYGLATPAEFGTPTVHIGLPFGNLTAYWRFDQGDPGSAVIPDRSGRSRHGWLLGGSYVSDGTYGNALSLNGTSDFGYLPDSCFAPGTGAKTLLVVAQSSLNDAAYRWVAGFGSNANNAGVFVGHFGNDVVGGGFGDGVVGSGLMPATGTWFTMALTYAGGVGGTVVLYLDGVPVASGSKTWTHVRAWGVVGKQISNFNEFWAGLIAQIVTFDGIALTAGQIATWAADPFGAMAPGEAADPTPGGTPGPPGVQDLAAWFDFSSTAAIFEDAGLTDPVDVSGDLIRGATDLSGNGLDATNSSADCVYIEPAINGLGALQGVASSNSRLSVLFNMNNNGSGAVPDKTIIVAGVTPSSIPFAFGPCLWGNDDGGWDQFMAFEGVGTNYGTKLRLSNQSGPVDVMDDVPLSTRFVISVRLSFGGLVRVRFNTVTKYSSYGLWGGGETTLTLGNINSSSALNPTVNMFIGEVAVFSRGLSDEEMYWVEEYMAAKFAVPSIVATGVPPSVAFGAVTVIAAQNIFPTGVATPAAFGTAALRSPVDVFPTGLSTPASFGTAVVHVEASSMAPTGLDASPTFGTPAVTYEVVPVPAGLAAGPAFGSPTIVYDQTVLPSGLGPTVVFGTTIVRVAQTVLPAGLDATPTFGTPTLKATQTLVPNGVNASPSFGTATISYEVVARPTGLNAAPAYGTFSVVTDSTVRPTGLDAGPTYGTAAVLVARTVLPTGLATPAAFGSPTVTADLTARPTGLAAAAAFGTVTVLVAIPVRPTGLSAAAAFGTLSVNVEVDVFPAGLTPTVAFGTARVLVKQAVRPTGLAAGPAFGSPTAHVGVQPRPFGLSATPAFGAPAARTELLTRPFGLAATPTIGGPTVRVAQRVFPAGVAASPQLGHPSVPVRECTDEHGRQGISVAQPQSGIDYPLIGPPSDDVRYLVADAWLSYRDPSDEDPAEAPFTPPFRLAWLYGFGTAPAALPSGRPTPTHAADVVVEDADGRVVFDSTEAVTSGPTPHSRYHTVDWGGRLTIHEWTTETQVFRLVTHACWSPNNAPFPVTYAQNIEPVNAVLDTRVVSRQPKTVRSLNVIFTKLDRTSVDLVAGYNMDMPAEGAPSNPGGRRVNTLTFNAVPGAGRGIFPGCDTPNQLVTQLAGVRPTAQGHFLLGASDCYWVRQPTQIVGGEAVPYVGIGENAAGIGPPTDKTNARLQIGNDCEPCCRCQDYVDLGLYINRTADRYQAIGDRLKADRTTYESNVNRWNIYAECVNNHPVKIQMLGQFCPFVDVVAQFCNKADACIRGIDMGIGFTSSIPATVVPGTTFIHGARTQPGSSRGLTERYRLGGMWPSFTATFDQLQPFATGWVKFRLRFDTCTIPATVQGCVAVNGRTECTTITLPCPTPEDQNDPSASVNPCT